MRSKKKKKKVFSSHLNFGFVKKISLPFRVTDILIDISKIRNPSRPATRKMKSFIAFSFSYIFGTFRLKYLNLRVEAKARDHPF